MPKILKSKIKYLFVFALTFFISNCGTPKYGDSLPLSGITLTIDPGHGNTEAYDSIRIGPSGEKRGMDKLKGGVDITDLLREAGARVIMTRETNGAGVYSDFLIYSEGTLVLRNAFPVLPGIIGEAGYFSNSASEVQMKDKNFNRLEAQSYFKAITRYAANGLPKAIPIVTKREDLIGDSLIVFKLTDGLGGHEFEASAFRVSLNDSTVDFEWKDSSGELSIIRCNSNEVMEIKIYGRNSLGNSLHPRKWEFLSEIGKAKQGRTNGMKHLTGQKVY